MRLAEDRLPYSVNTFSWSLDDLEPEVCRHNTRFWPEQIEELAELLLSVDTLRFKARCKAEPWQALYMVCQRLAYPDRWYHQVRLRGRSLA